MYAVAHVVVVGLNLEVVLPQQPRMGLWAALVVVQSVRGDSIAATGIHIHAILQGVQGLRPEHPEVLAEIIVGSVLPQKPPFVLHCGTIGKQIKSDWRRPTFRPTNRTSVHKLAIDSAVLVSWQFPKRRHFGLSQLRRSYRLVSPNITPNCLFMLPVYLKSGENWRFEVASAAEKCNAYWNLIIYCKI